MKTRTKTISYGPAGNGPRWIENASLGLRVCPENATETTGGSRRITGYYCDPFQDSVTYGAVLQLPARQGKPQYVPAYSDPWNEDCYSADFDSVTNDKSDAARWADRMAEQFAEQEREYQVQQLAEQDIEDARATVAAMRARIRALTSTLRQAGEQPAAICAALRRDIAAARAESAAAHDIIRAREDNPWTAAPY